MYIIPQKHISITLWTVAGAFFNPNGILLGLASHKQHHFPQIL